MLYFLRPFLAIILTPAQGTSVKGLEDDTPITSKYSKEQIVSMLNKDTSGNKDKQQLQLHLLGRASSSDRADVGVLRAKLKAKQEARRLKCDKCAAGACDETLNENKIGCDSCMYEDACTGGDTFCPDRPYPAGQCKCNAALSSSLSFAIC